MTKEELLRVYSAYLPYGLQCYNEVHGIQTLDCWSSISRIKAGNYVHLQGMINKTSKPILYYLSYLTKEIEHKGNIFTPIERIKLCCDEAHFKYIERFIYYEDSVSILPWWVIELLLEWHFNVFNLPEGDFINKSTLTNK